MSNLADRQLMGHEEPKVRALFEIFKKRLDQICDDAVGTPVCAGHGHLMAIHKFIEGLKPLVVNVRDDELYRLLNVGPIDAYAIKNPSSSIHTILIAREFGEKVLALGLP